MTRRSTAARLDQVQHNIDTAIAQSVRAMSDDDLRALIDICDSFTAGRRKLAADQAELWRKFTEDYRRRYAELQQRDKSFIAGA